jgi:hypothetical protein
MPGSFTYDVFLSHNSQDKPQVRKLAERLKEAGLRVWFDDWVIKPGDDIYLAIERGLEAARVQVLCLSPSALGSEWVTLERSTVLFRNPSNAGRRFVPLLLADCTLPDTLRRYKYVDFCQETPEAFDELLAACREEAEAAPPVTQMEPKKKTAKPTSEKTPEKKTESLVVLERKLTGQRGSVNSVAVSPDGKLAASGSRGLNLTIGEKISSARKKIDDYLKSHKIETELFGVVQFSLGKIKIDPDPDTWTKIEEAKIEEIVEKTAGISLQEYRELLRSEISSKDISEIKAQIEEIGECIRSHKEYPLLSPDEFERMQENKFLLKYKNFIGRDEELQKLHDFVNGEDKIGFIVGRGGVGKTKLALKFSKQMNAEGGWEVYFVNRYADFHLTTLNDKTLLILDEAWGYKHREKMVNFVLNILNNNIKLLMIDRPISEESIKSDWS